MSRSARVEISEISDAENENLTSRRTNDLAEFASGTRGQVLTISWWDLAINEATPKQRAQWVLPPLPPRYLPP